MRKVAFWALGLNQFLLREVSSSSATRAPYPSPRWDAWAKRDDSDKDDEVWCASTLGNLIAGQVKTTSLLMEA